jgi:hypothetical protein
VCCRNARRPRSPSRSLPSGAQLPQQATTGDGKRGNPGHDPAVLLAECRARRQLDFIAARCPGHTITVETHPGRQDRYVAHAVTAPARPYPLITTDLDELSTELCGRSEHPQVTPLPRSAPGTSWTPPRRI